MLTIPNDSHYYQRRETQCRALAEQALDPHIRQLHLDFAARYAHAVRESAMSAPQPWMAASQPAV